MIVINVFAFLFSTIKKKHFFVYLSIYPLPRIPILPSSLLQQGNFLLPNLLLSFSTCFQSSQIHSLSSRTHRYISLSVYYAMTPTNLKLYGNKITSFFINPAIVPVLLPVKITNDDRETKILFSQIFSCCKASYCTAQKSSSLH